MHLLDDCFIFRYLNLTGDTLLLITAIFHSSVSLYVVSLMLLFLNLCPLIWLKILFPRYYLNGLSFLGDLSILDVITKKYKISSREREIVELLLQGSSNKEIENKLFISLNTVKNHIYRIYQKLGVKSRGQLVYFIMDAQKRQ